MTTLAQLPCGPCLAWTATAGGPVRLCYTCGHVALVHCGNDGVRAHVCPPLALAPAEVPPGAPRKRHVARGAYQRRGGRLVRRALALEPDATGASRVSATLQAFLAHERNVEEAEAPVVPDHRVALVVPRQ
jgi:hypothetical protein